MKRALRTAALIAALAGCSRGESPGGNAAAPSNPDATQNAVSGPVAGPEAAVFAEYDRACRDLSSAERLNQAAAGGGWQSYAPPADSDAGKLLAFAETNVRPLLQGSEFRNWSYRKQVGGRELVLVVTDIPTGPARSTECRVYDFAAPSPPSDATIASWTSAAPTQRLAEQGLTAFEWTPGFRDGLSQQSVVYLDRNSPLRQEIPAVGLGVTATRGAASVE